MRTLPAILGVLLASLLAPTLAAAQSTGELGAADDRGRSRFTLDLGFYYGRTDLPIVEDRDRALFVPSLFVSADVVELTPEVALAFDLAFRSALTAGRWLIINALEDRTDFRAGNLYLGAAAVIRPMRHLRIRGGFGVVAPFMNVYEADSLFGGDIAPRQMPLTLLPNGGWDPWLAARGYVPIVLRGDGEYRQDWLFFGGELGFAVGVPVLDGYESVSLAAQLGIFGGVRPIDGLATGLRLQATMHDLGRIAGGESDAVGFFSIVPFVRGELNAAFAELRFFLSLADNSYYDANDEKAWGLYLLLGSDFDVR